MQFPKHVYSMIVTTHLLLQPFTIDGVALAGLLVHFGQCIGSFGPSFLQQPCSDSYAMAWYASVCRTNLQGILQASHLTFQRPHALKQG
jgi:hypothetical protein